MGYFKTLNKTRLTKKQVQEIIESEGHLHDGYTEFFSENYGGGSSKRDLVYELPNDRFLYVYDPDGVSIPGKGDIFSKELFLKRIERLKRIREDIKYQRSSSVSHWRYYSKNKNNLILLTDSLVHELADNLSIDRDKLDKSYQSLDLVSYQSQAQSLDYLFTNLYDNLVAYIGEVIKERIKGQWDINQTHAGGEYPFISLGLKNVQHMPINAAWTAMTGIDPIDFRKETANEVRSNASKVKFYRQHGHLLDEEQNH